MYVCSCVSVRMSVCVCISLSLIMIMCYKNIKHFVVNLCKFYLARTKIIFKQDRKWPVHICYS